jgi:hypothetical protein
MRRLNREQMLEILQAFDRELERPIKIIITGAAALIIQGCVSRVSRDIDVLNASDDIKQEAFKKIIEKIAVKYSLDQNWLNDDAQETFKDLPGYQPDLIRVKGKFKHLDPYIISKADSVITKFARYTNIRSWDISDIRETPFDEKDFITIRKKLGELFKKDPERSLRIEIEFKAIKPEFIKTENGFSYTNSSEVAHYAFKRFGIKVDAPFKKHLDQDVMNLNSSYAKAVIDIDTMALKQIVTAKEKK